MERLDKRFFSDHLDKERAYWLEKLAGKLTMSGLPLDFKRPDVFTGHRGDVSIELDSQTVRRLFGACGDNESLIFAILVAALKICLHKYTGVEDVIVATTIHEQHSEDALLNKVLLLRDRVTGATTVRQLLQDVKRTLAEAYSNEKFPFERLLEILGIDVPSNQAPLFNVAVMLDNINNKQNLEHIENDITIAFSIVGDKITGTVEYNVWLFHEESISLFVQHYGQVIKAVLDNPDRTISEIKMTSKEEEERLSGFNKTYREYPKDKTIHQLFEEQAKARTAFNSGGV